MNKVIKVKKYEDKIRIFGINSEIPEQYTEIDFHTAVDMCRGLKKEIREVAADMYLKVANVGKL